MVTTAGHGSRSGSACWKWPSAAPSRRSRRGSVTAIRSSWTRRAQRDGLDPVGHELGVARDGGDPQPGLGRERRERAQEVEHVGLVAGAVAPEHVGVDDDERLHASSRQTVSTASATASPRVGLRTLEPEPRAARRVARRLLDPGRDRVDVERVDEHRGAAGDLLGRAARARDDGRAAGHRLEHRDPEPLVERREGERSGRRGRARRAPRPTPRPASPASRRRPSPCAPTTRSSTPARLRRLGDPAQVLARLERADREHVVALGGRAVRRETRIDGVADHGHAGPRARRAARPPPAS